ncbi:MAG TPA: carboxypeptidase-like regulatory domain-containing protein, partial [Chitinophagaceae bacterium]
MRTAACTFICLLLLCGYSGFAQTVVEGTVRDEKEPLAGVNVIVKHTNTGALTNASGHFNVRAAKGDTLVFSYTGYQTQEVAVDNRSNYSITLINQAQEMENVVVIGYGSKKKEFLTGAVSTVNAEVFQSRPITNAFAALQGEVSGTYIQRYSGQPGSEDFNLNVRGPSSINGAASPLVLIDGVVGNLALLNPSDIESISVLKDAQASIYGARAAGGVFLVTTKKGRGGATKITYNNNFAVTKMTGMMESPTNYQMALMDNEANIHNGAAPMYTPEMLQKILNNDPNPI